MALNLGGSAVSDVRLGTGAVSKLYLGSTEVWPATVTPSAVLTDNFNRTSTTTPGSAQTGQAWTAVNGTWGTDGSRIYAVTAADGNIATIDPGVSNADITITLAQVSGTYFARLFLRYAGPFNGYWLEASNGGGANLNRDFTTLGTVPASTIAAGAVIRCWIREDAGATRITVWVNGTQHIDVTDSTAGRPTQTVIGLRHGASGAANIRWDDLSVTAT